MKKTTHGARAHELETVVAESAGDYLNRRLYTVDGHAGLWRRVSEGTEGSEVMTVFLGKGLARMVPAKCVNDEIEQCGFYRDEGVPSLPEEEKMDEDRLPADEKMGDDDQLLIPFPETAAE